MHQFIDLVERATILTLGSLKEASERIQEHLRTSAATSLVKGLQTIRLQKGIMAVGMFSMFEAILQDRLECEDGFAGARECLDRAGEVALKYRFSQFAAAINVLKHGRGPSYDKLLADGGSLPFRLLRPDEYFFNEGDVSEISTLVEVDEAFVLGCAKIIREVSDAINKLRPGVWI